MTEKTVFEKFSEWVAGSVTLKLFGIGFILLLLLIPLEMVRDVIRERGYYQDEVKHEIMSEWSGEQIIEGPVLTVPYERLTLITTTEGKTVETREEGFVHFLPETLNYQGQLNMEKRERGIYEVNVYSADLTISGSFNRPQHSIFTEENITVHWNRCQIAIAIPDQRGVQEELSMKWNDSLYTFTSGTTYNTILNSGVSTIIDLSDPTSQASTFNLKANLRGSGRIGFTPLGKTTTAHLSSTWKDPKYFGNFLPDQRNDPNESGFDAQWKVLHLNRSIPQTFTADVFNTRDYTFGVELFEEVGEYRKTERSAKYAVLFIALTFVTFFFIQLIKKVRVHVLQFIIVGLALCLFYVLLLSLSEYVGFNYAYLIASAAIILQISWYVKHIFRDMKLTTIVFFVLAALYFFIFTLVQLANYSLLMGSIGLFIVMGILMYLSRNMDWASRKE
ncbi:MAG: cell envelope integrity protein CreD [Bacteroidota bacterium]